MTRTIPIDDDIYEFLRRNSDFGETPSTVLRRFLPLDGAGQVARAGGGKNSPGSVAAHESTLIRFVLDPAFPLEHAAATDKFTAVLGFAARHKGDMFENVLKLRGHRRIYFARSRKEIEASGTNTQPREIPGSPYWVMTNTDTRRKREMLGDVLQMLRYTAEEVRAAVEAIS